MRGSLAGDAAWLRDMRRQVTGIADPEGLWDVADRDEIRVLFAGDVPGHRLALVLVPLRLDLITDAPRRPSRRPVRRRRTRTTPST